MHGGCMQDVDAGMHGMDALYSSVDADNDTL